MIALWFLLGCAVALAAGMSIRWSVNRLGESASPARTVTVVAGGALARMAAAALVLGIALRQGIVEGLLAFVGLWLGRWVAVAVLSRRRTGLCSQVPSRMESL